MAANPLPSRDDLEADLMKALGKVDRATRKKIVDALGDPPDIAKLTSDLWSEVTTAYQQAVMPHLETTYLTAAQTLSEAVGVGMDWTLVNQGAMDWSRQYSYDLVRGMTDNSRAAIQQAVGDFYSGATDNAHLQQRIARLYSPNRANSIAITEVTRASVQGDAATVAGLERQGLKLTAIWDTVSDGHVCPLCDPRDGKAQGDGWYDLPPLHPRCRCGVHYVVADTGNMKAIAVGQIIRGLSAKRAA